MKKINFNSTKTTLMLCAAISLLLGAAAGAVLGNNFANVTDKKEGDGYSPELAAKVDNIGIASVGPDAQVAWMVRFDACGHEAEEKCSDRIVGMSLEEVREKYENREISVFNAKRVVLTRAEHGYCPRHYVVRSDNGKIAVYKRSIDTLEENHVMDIEQKMDELDENFKAELQSGIPFSNFDEINQYFENADS
ncbi:MAG: hypothetical protein IJO48_02585 [Clostridia bacterium]|nr:hypothetical protein [Clostridia bacterium]